MSNTRRIRLSDSMKDQIEKKMRDDYTKVSRVIRNIDDKEQKKEMLNKLLSAYIRKRFELTQGTLKLQQLLKNKSLIDVFIPGFDTEARKYIFKNPDPYGYRLMAQNGELMPLTDFIWEVLSGETFMTELKNNFSNFNKENYLHPMKIWQITGHLINMFAFKDNIDLTFFFNFGKSRREIEEESKKLGIPFEARRSDVGKKKGKQPKRGQPQRGQRGQRGGQPFNQNRQNDRGFQNRNERDRRDRNNRGRNDRGRDQRNRPMRESGFTKNSLDIFKKIEIDSVDGLISVNDFLNNIIKIYVKEKYDEDWKKGKVEKIVPNYEELRKNLNKAVIKTGHKNNSNNSNKQPIPTCHIADYIGLAGDVEKFRDIFNKNLYYNEQKFRQYFFDNNIKEKYDNWAGRFDRCITGKRNVTNFENRLKQALLPENEGNNTGNNANNNSNNNENNENNYGTINNNNNSLFGGKRKSHKKPKREQNNSKFTPEQKKDKLKRCLIENVFTIDPLNINAKDNFCNITDVFKDEVLFEPFEIKKYQDLIKKYVWNLSSNYNMIENMYRKYRFQSLNFIDTISQDDLKALLTIITQYLTEYYKFFLKEYNTYTTRLMDEFGVNIEEYKALVAKIAPAYVDVKAMKAMKAKEAKENQNQNQNRNQNLNKNRNQNQNINKNKNKNKNKNSGSGLPSELQKKQDAIRKITDLITKYKNEPEKVERLQELLQKAREM